MARTSNIMISREAVDTNVIENTEQNGEIISHENSAKSHSLLDFLQKIY
jgi:hypothetical protein